ncbi:myrosinase 1-like isoform X2 [Leptidea sinapis]|uniref:myrosinase 1-like isoform X2 n=1 Tax=Leptidea sinapis TaxID=189913 RepID=UPI002129D328|nr:myrosinase 1-like isoform X2 [Leptidea sinapis]XP_050670536.1 myrosinase 1-like isoform X2 [Leptidea sinapis]
MRCQNLRITVAFCLTLVVVCGGYSRHGSRRLPDDLLLGAATASYQIEGAWDADGKSENIFDYAIHNQPCYAIDCSNGDVAANSYYLYKRDVEMLRELGVNFYRFSLSWTRLFPTSFTDKINKAGVEYYNNLIDELLKNNIQPVVTLFHWDMPQKLQQLGGWLNNNIVDWFGDYAEAVFVLFGDRVKYWITVNEPFQICEFGYGNAILIPALNLTGEADYICTKNLLLAHARAYHVYDELFRPKQDGIIFITISTEWFEPADNSNIEAANDANQFWWGIYAHPIFSKHGDYPRIIKERVALKSRVQGLPRSRLPELSPDEIKYIHGSSDLFGLNHYSSAIAYRNASTYYYYSSFTGPSHDADAGYMSYKPPEWKIGESDRTMYAPWGFSKILAYIRNVYNNVPVFITENGFASHGGLVDDDRVTYYRGYISAMLDAIDEGSYIIGYTAWSLMDNFEWWNGYRENYGLYEVDFNDTSRPRTPRKSAYVYKEIIRTRTLDMNYEPDMSIPLTFDLL